MTEQYFLNMTSETSTNNSTQPDHNTYHEALNNASLGGEADAYADHAATHGKGLTAPLEHFYAPSASSKQHLDFGDFNFFDDHAQNSAVYDTVEVDQHADPYHTYDASGFSHVPQNLTSLARYDQNNHGAYPELPATFENRSHAYPEPSSPSTAFGQDSDWFLPDTNILDPELPSQESGTFPSVPSYIPSPPSLVYTSSPTTTDHRLSPAGRDMLSAAHNPVMAPVRVSPDTYAGRRAPKAREDYPWECGACNKRYLYENSAVKHWRQHHDGPANIIQRRNAPKRPAPGRARNNKATKSQVRRGMMPPPATTSVKAPLRQTVSGSRSPKVHQPVLTYFADGQPVYVGIAGAGAASFKVPAGTLCSAVSTHSAQLDGHYDLAQAADPSDDFDAAGTNSVNYHPGSGKMSMEVIDPALLATPPAERSPHNHRYDPAAAACFPQPLNSSAFEHPQNSSVSPVATLINQRPLPPLTTIHAPDTAQEALRDIRHRNPTSASHHAQEASIDRQRLHFQDSAVNATQSSSLAQQSGNNDAIAGNAHENVLAGCAHSDPVPFAGPTMSQLNTHGTTGSVPSWPLLGSFDEQNHRIVLHPHYQRWYKCFDGVWKHWDNKVCGWAVEP